MRENVNEKCQMTNVILFFFGVFVPFSFFCYLFVCCLNKNIPDVKQFPILPSRSHLIGFTLWPRFYLAWLGPRGRPAVKVPWGTFGIFSSYLFIFLYCIFFFSFFTAPYLPDWWYDALKFSRKVKEKMKEKYVLVQESLEEFAEDLMKSLGASKDVIKHVLESLNSFVSLFFIFFCVCIFFFFDERVYKYHQWYWSYHFRSTAVIHF